MAKKVYAVRRGRVTGLFSSWDACSDAIRGYSGAEYKGFNSEEQAKAYLEGGVEFTQERLIDKPRRSDSVNIYTKCSCKDGICGIGVCLESSDVERQFYCSVKCADSISGQLLAVLCGVELAVDMHYTTLNIISDYQGVESWYTGEWKAKLATAKEYVKVMQALSDSKSVTFNFIRHKGNKSVNMMASRALKFNSAVDVTKILRGSLVVEDVPLYR